MRAMIPVASILPDRTVLVVSICYPDTVLIPGMVRTPDGHWLKPWRSP